MTRLASISPLATLAALTLAALLPTFATAAPSLRSTGSGVTLSLEGEAGQSLPTYYHRGVTYVLGEMGERYNVRIANGTGERVEVVLTVDGRDAITGANGDWRTQRGYVVPPYGSIVVDGFRRSMSEVAAFRFTTRGDSYSGRRGTPQNAGVIGAAVFHERRERPQAIAPPQQPVEPPYWGHNHRDEAGPARKSPSGGLGSGGDFDDGRARAETTAAPAEDAPAPAAPAASGAAEQSAAADAAKGKAADAYSPERRGGGYSSRPAPRPRQNNLGTQYGEGRYSPVSEVPFRRARNAPDQILGLYYDDARGLSARGIAVYPATPIDGPQPFPVNRSFAPPPP
jgi:hypothetical protein